MKSGIMVAGLLLGGMLAGCSSDSDGGRENTPYTPISLTPGQTRACEKNNDFALSYLQKTIAESNSENVAVSPFTVYGLLGMLANGASGETRAEIVEVMGFDDLDEMNSYYSTLSTTLPTADSRTDLSIATSVWTKPEVSFKSEYLQKVGEFYGSEVRELSNDNGKNLADINKWASDKTRGKISDFLSKFNSNTMAVLFSATYFKGRWSTVFDKKKTVSEDFLDASGAFLKKTPMMTGDQSVDCYVSDMWSAVDLRYGNGSFMMTVILPDEGKTVEECLASLSPESLTETSSCYIHSRTLDIKLPRFKILPETGSIKSVLEGMGLTKAFDPYRSDYSGISELSGLYFDNILQSTTITVDEEGTEAASVQVSQGATSNIASGKFYVNRPFIFMIRERSTGVILFSGVVRNPVI